MCNHRNPQASVSKQAPSDNFNPSDRTVLLELLKHAASAARIIGHLDDAIAAGPLAEHVDTIVHGLTELLGDPHALAVPDAVAPGAHVAYDGAPMLTSSCRATGGAS